MASTTIGRYSPLWYVHSVRHLALHLLQPFTRVSRNSVLFQAQPLRLKCAQASCSNAYPHSFFFVMQILVELILSLCFYICDCFVCLSQNDFILLSLIPFECISPALFVLCRFFICLVFAVGSVFCFSFFFLGSHLCRTNRGQFTFKKYWGDWVVTQKSFNVELFRLFFGSLRGNNFICKRLLPNGCVE